MRFLEPSVWLSLWFVVMTGTRLWRVNTYISGTRPGNERAGAQMHPAGLRYAALLLDMAFQVALVLASLEALGIGGQAGQVLSLAASVSASRLEHLPLRAAQWVWDDASRPRVS